MKIQEYPGEFYLPDHNTRVPGRLSVDDDARTITLEIFTNTTFKGSVLRKFVTPQLDYYHEIVIGECVPTYSKEITLVDCRLVSGSYIGKENFLIKYRVRTILLGHAFHDIKSIKLQSITVSIPFLSSWYDGSKSLDKFTELSQLGGFYSESININDKLSIEFEDHLQESLVEIGFITQTKYFKFVKFLYNDYEILDNIIQDILTLTKCISFSLQKIIQFKLEYGKVFNENTQEIDDNNFDQNIDIINFSLSNKQDTYQNDLHSTYMLFSSWSLEKDQLKKVVKKWYENDVYYTVYELYLDSINWFNGTDAFLTNVMFNNRFLNIVQALEDYYRKSYDNFKSERKWFEERKSKLLAALGSDKELMNWAAEHCKFKKHITLSSKLNSLIQDSVNILNHLFHKTKVYDNFSTEAVLFRDNLSHGKVEKTNQGRKLEKLFFMSRLLLLVCILKSLDLPEQLIEKITSNNRHVKDDIREILMRNKD